MNQDAIIKLCRMTSRSYELAITYYDTDGKLIFCSHDLKELFLKHLVNSEKHIVQQCTHSENIQININEMAMAYLGIPLIRKEHNAGSIVIGPFYCYGLSEKILFDIIDQVDMKEEGKKYLRSYWRYLPGSRTDAGFNAGYVPPSDYGEVWKSPDGNYVGTVGCSAGRY